MFKLIKAIMPRSDNFFDLFEAQARKAHEAAMTLRSILDGGDGTADKCARLSTQEEEADQINYEVMQSIRRSFITPFDRSDIKALSSALDDAIDQMNKTGKTVMLYDVVAFQPNMRAMGDRIILLANILTDALPLMRDIGKHSSQLHQMVGEIGRIEEQSDQMYDTGLKELFKATPKDQALDFIIGAELYDRLEKVCDRFEDVAHVMGDIVIEHV
jgi:predicted phosphate transport protein (TIGR00153 family)